MPPVPPRPPGVPGRLVQCKGCLAIADIPDGTDPHSVTWCGCCTQDHHHGENAVTAGECAGANHPGMPCWHPPAQPERPAGCTVCRPVMHLGVAGEMRFPAGG